MRDYTAKEYFNRMRRNPAASNEQQAREAREWEAFAAIRVHPVGPERSAAVQDWLSLCREGRKRENIGMERDRQLMGLHATADKIRRADYWAERAKTAAADHSPMRYFVRDREQERDR